MKTAISLENIKKTMGNREVLKGISFTVASGDIFGYLGPNGAGKTTTIRILLGLLQADSGRLDIMGQDISRSDTRRKIGFALDPDGLYDNMTAEENLEFYARIYGLLKAEARIAGLLGAVGLSARARDKVGTYSKGMRQRLALARAMTHDPEVVVLDEPTAGVDPSGQIEVRQILLDMAHKENKTIFLSSHNLDEVQRICNRIALIDRGEIKLYGEVGSLRRGMGGGAVVIETSAEVPQGLLDELRALPRLGLRENRDRSLFFSPQEGTGVSDIISWLSEHRVKIEKAARQEATLEEMYSAILKEVEPI
ncbi:MAG: transporter-related protein, could be related with Lipooligosaccharide exporter, ATP-binding [Chloroflexi bacterium]|nr:transporter-related protein, could be related with Lipooligosaccharide exporter, ATP-binding [Chloroflexota bacterium]